MFEKYGFSRFATLLRDSPTISKDDISRVLSPEAGAGGGSEGRVNFREKMPAIATFDNVRIGREGDVQTETHLFVMKG